MFTFEPLTQSFIDKQRELPKKGIYPFTTLEAGDYYAKSTGQPMIKLLLKINDKTTGKSHTTFFYGNFTGKFAFQTLHYLKSIGRKDLAESGSIPDFNVLNNTQGFVDIYIGQDSNGADQIKVKDFLVEPSTASVSSKTTVNAVIPDHEAFPDEALTF